MPSSGQKGLPRLVSFTERPSTSKSSSDASAGMRTRLFALRAVLDLGRVEEAGFAMAMLIGLHYRPREKLEQLLSITTLRVRRARAKALYTQELPGRLPK